MSLYVQRYFSFWDSWTLLHLDWPNLNGGLAILSAIGLVIEEMEYDIA